VCCQSLPKYLPRHDAVFVQIAARVPAAQFLFIGTSAAAVEVLHGRLQRCFAVAGLPAEQYVRFVPPVSVEDFPALLRCADVFLDSIGWSGGNTTLEAIACGLPVVTVPTGLMRGRHSAAILQHMGLGDRVSSSVDDFVEQAVRLADPTAAAPALRRPRAGARVGAIPGRGDYRKRPGLRFAAACPAPFAQSARDRVAVERWRHALCMLDDLRLYTIIARILERFSLSLGE